MEQHQKSIQDDVRRSREGHFIENANEPISCFPTVRKEQIASRPKKPNLEDLRRVDCKQGKLYESKAEAGNDKIKEEIVGSVSRSEIKQYEETKEADDGYKDQNNNFD